MSSHLGSNSHSSDRHQAASLLLLLSWIGFWIQFGLTIVAGVILGFAILDPTLNLGLKSGISLLSVIDGIAALSLSIYWFFRYVRLGKRLEAPEPALHPNRKEIVQILQLGVLVNLVAMLLKTLSVPQGAVIYRTGQLIEPIDVFVVQANISMIVAQFVGIGIPFWLASRLEHR